MPEQSPLHPVEAIFYSTAVFIAVVGFLVWVFLVK